MTPEERREAAEVMASDGPWKCRERGATAKFLDVECPVFDWHRYEYIVAPQPIIRYLNIYKSGSRTFCGSLKDTKQLADSDVVNPRFACVRLEFVEGQRDD